MRGTQKRMVIMLVVISISILTISVLGICIARPKKMPFKRCFLIVFGLISFGLGFLPPVIYGGSMLTLSRVKP